MLPRERKGIPKCSRCALPGGYRGILYRVMRQHVSVKALQSFLSKHPAANPLDHVVRGTQSVVTRRITEPMCQRHYMENTFGLWPYSCIQKCRLVAQSKSDIVLLGGHLIVWLDMAPSFGGIKPKCPWCGKRRLKGHVGPIT